jgi:hypothetical protein
VKFGEFLHEEEENGFEEVPIFGASGEESAKAENGGSDFVNVDDSEVAWPEAATSKPKRN